MWQRRSTRRRSFVVLTSILALLLSLAGHAVAAQSVSVASQSVVASADTYVARVPATRNFGSQTQLRASRQLDERSYLRFNVPAATTTLSKATLRIYPTTTNSTGILVTDMSATLWDEYRMTYQSAPAVRTINPLKSGPVVAGRWVEIDVTSIVRGKSTASMAFTTTSTTALTFSSRETTRAPHIVYEFERPQETPTTAPAPDQEVSPSPTTEPQEPSGPTVPDQTQPETETSEPAPSQPEESNPPAQPEPIAAPAPLPSGAYFLSPSGNDANPGTETAPFRTFTHALKRLRPGDTLLVRGGTYTERAMLRGSDLKAGTQSSRITVQAYPGERPVVVGLFWLSNAHYWTIDGINVTWDSNTGNREEHMVRMYGGTGWVYQNAELWGARSYAALLIANGASNWNVNNMYIHDTHPSNNLNQDHLIYVSGASNGVIEYSLLVNATNGRGIKLGSHVDGTSLPSGITVRFNTIVNSNAGNVSLSYDANNNHVYNNVLVSAGAGYASVGEYHLSGKGNIASANLFFDSRGVVKTGTALVDGGGNVLADPQLSPEYRPANPAAYDASGKLIFGHLAGR